MNTYNVTFIMDPRRFAALVYVTSPLYFIVSLQLLDCYA